MGPAIAQKPHVSPSGLDMYARCGEQWRRRYIMGDRMPPGVALVKGGAVHRAAEANFRQKVETHRDLPEGDMQEVAAAHVDQTIAGEGLMLGPDETTRGVAIVKGEIIDRATLLTRLFARYVAPPIQPVLVEKLIKIELPKHSHDLVGRLDVVDDKDQVRDVKTSSRRKNQDEVDHSDQLTFYHAAMEHETGRAPQGVILDVLVDTKTPAVQQLKSTRTIADKRVFLNKLNAMMDGVAKGVFHPAPLGSWWCSPRFCGYWWTCPYVNSERTSAAEGGPIYDR